jgi:hypothetical protein
VRLKFFIEIAIKIGTPEERTNARQRLFQATQHAITSGL